MSAATIHDILADTSTLDYIAMKFCEAEHAQQNKIVPRWLCMEHTLRLKYLKQAKLAYLEWAEDERDAQVRRTNG